MRDINMVKVENFLHINQFAIYTDRGVVFQSYDSFICEIEMGDITKIGYNWNFSRTTSKHLKWFLEKYLRYNNPYTTKKDFEKYLEKNFIYDDDLKYYKLKK